MQIFVRTLGGQTIALESHVDDTVQTLKTQLKVGAGHKKFLGQQTDTERMTLLCSI